MSLFAEGEIPETKAARPLAERLRPILLDDFVGQEDLIGPGKPLRTLHERGRPASLLFWGPPGTGKTTLARLLANSWEAEFREFSAVLSGVAEVRRSVEEARRLLDRGRRTVLFVDEIHRFNKAQQDAFLPHVESGVITLLGATTENPSFEIIPALLSRCRVMVLKPLGREDLERILDRALADREKGLGELDVSLEDGAAATLLDLADGDARRLLTTLEVAVDTAPLGPGGGRSLTPQVIAQAAGRRRLPYDKAGDQHYNLISAFIKSLRGSDPDAALYWLARMLEGGEDPHFILRRMTVFATEDVGLADPFAINQVAAVRQAFDLVGLPEAGMILGQAAVYLALAPRANSVYKAWEAAKADAAGRGPLPVPDHLRNAPTALMKAMGYGEKYMYPHDYSGGVVDQTYLPEALKGRRYFKPGERGREKFLRERLEIIARMRRKHRAEGKGGAGDDQGAG